MPEAGGDYIYLTRGLSSVWGFLFGWTSAMMLKPGAATVITAGIVRLVGFVVPSIATPIFTGMFDSPRKEARIGMQSRHLILLKLVHPKKSRN